MAIVTIPRLAWMAGVLDLKGRVTFKNNKQRADGSRQIVLYVESREMSVINELCKLTGTSVELKEADMSKDFFRRSCVEHCPDTHTHVTHSWPRVARWTITGASMAVVLTNVLPYLHNNREPYKQLVNQALTQAVFTGQGSAAIVKSILRLERLGWVLPKDVQHKLKGATDDGDQQGEAVRVAADQ